MISTYVVQDAHTLDHEDQDFAGFVLDHLVVLVEGDVHVDVQHLPPVDVQPVSNMRQSHEPQIAIGDLHLLQIDHVHETAVVVGDRIAHVALVVPFVLQKLRLIFQVFQSFIVQRLGTVLIFLPLPACFVFFKSELFVVSVDHNLGDFLEKEFETSEIPETGRVNGDVGTVHQMHAWLSLSVDAQVLDVV